MSSRKEQKEQLREERLAKQQAADSAAQRKKLVGYAAAAVLALGALVAVVVALTAGGGDDDGAQAPDNAAAGAPTVTYAEDPPDIPPASEFDLEAAAEAAGCQLEDPANEGADHVETDVEYQANPPTSGNHHPVPTEDGAYTSTPKTENTVHSLEHGRINIQFSPDLPQQQIDQLKALFDEDSYHLLLYPNGTDMPYQVAATTWDHALLCEEFNPQVFDAIRAFKDQYRDQGPEFVP
ncbi:MAG: DUF3105 domain-containing protein [Thermoleophilaceae bacterium]